MGELREIITRQHSSTSRDYLGRMMDQKVACMEVARQYDKDFWDGDRRFGYGGYRYDGRWRPIAEQLIAIYNLTGASAILDAGCGKGYLLYELHQLLPGAKIVGFDISEYAIREAKPEIRDALFVHRAQDPLPYGKNEFDLVISIMTIYNLLLPELKAALAEIERVGRRGYVVMESYRNLQELFNLQCWALTCECFFRPEEWIWLFGEFGFNGDYEFAYFE